MHTLVVLSRVVLSVAPLTFLILSPENINVLTGSACLATPFIKVYLITGSFMHGGKRPNIEYYFSYILQVFFFN